MSRLWSRFGVRAISVMLLLVGVAGGVYLGQSREVQQQGIVAQRVALADAAELELINRRKADHSAAIAPQRRAEADALRKAELAAKADAERALRAAAASRKKEREKKVAAEAKKAAEAAENAEPKPYAGPIPASCNEYSGNRKTGCALLLDRGFGIDQMPCLDKLWTKESGWNHKAHNSSSGAHGIPQALPGSKMGAAGDDWESNPATQIKWGLGYIAGRYGKPCSAWAHSQDVGWY